MSKPARREKIARLSKSRIASALALCLLAVAPLSAQPAPELGDLREGFISPPADARPWTWFHVMSGNMTREGLTKDLEALAENGVGGIVLFHVTQGISIGPVVFNSPEHLDLIAHAAAECQRLGIRFAFHNADGWSSTGGPWITPEQSMKKLVWTQKLVTGGEIALDLEQPIAQEGLYEDIAVIAYPALAGEVRDQALSPRISASDPSFDIARARDGDPRSLAALQVNEGEKGWLQFDYAQPIDVRTVMIDNIPDRNVAVGLEISPDGINFQPALAFDKPRLGKSEWSVNSSFEPVRARHFRITSDMSFSLGEIQLSTNAQVDNPAGHTILAYVFGVRLPETISVPDEAVIASDKVINLTHALGEDGQLEASLPAGNWSIMRFGYTSTGARNVNASAEGVGLEVDKFDAAAFQTHYDAFIGPVIARSREVAPDALAAVMIDSYEVGGQNWTQGYLAKFAERHGVDLTPWLPIFAGKVVGGGQETREMLARIRQFNEELVRENYYTAFAEAMRAEGLESYVQPYGNGPLNEVEVGATASVPAGEFWLGRETLNVGHAVSAARMYDKRIIAAEAFTGEPQVNWDFSPALGKKWGDWAWTAGVNHFLFHRFAHQANTHVVPGMTMNRWGSHFDRTQPWWDNGGAAWFRYMARGQFLLRQGHAVSDIALFMGEDSPVECPEKTALADRLPAGAEYDCIDAETLLRRARFEDGAMVLPNGARYNMIWWPHRRAPSPAAEARMLEARAAGIAVALEHRRDDPAAVFTSAGMAPRLIADGPLPRFTQRRISKDNLFFIANFEDEPLTSELSFAATGAMVEVWDPVTGKMFAADARAVDGRTVMPLSLAASQSLFVAFHAEPPREGSTALPALLPPAGAAARPSLAVNGPWQVAFDADYGFGKTVEWPRLQDWATSEDPEIRHFSGKANYTARITLPARSAAQNERVFLDAGVVEVAAKVRVNGRDVGTLWTAPYRIDVTDALVEGENTVEIEVANLWVNRLIGDAALPDTSDYKPEGRVPERRMVDWYSANEPAPEGPRKTFATQYFHRADDPLTPSGLIGPVTVHFMKVENNAD